MIGASDRLPKTLGRGRECSTPWSCRRLRNLEEQRVGYRERSADTENTPLGSCSTRLLQE